MIRLGCNTIIITVFLILVSLSGLAAARLSEVVMVDAKNGTVYLQNQQGYLVATTINTGLKNWQSSLIMKPINIIDSQVVVQIQAEKKGQIRLAYINASNGEMHSTVDVSLPNEVNALVKHTMNESFQIKVDENNMFWAYNHFSSGAQFSENASNKTIFGRLNIDSQSRGIQNSTINRAQYPKNNRTSNTLNNVSGRQIYSEDGQNIVVINNNNTDKNGYFYVWQFYDLSGNKLTEFKSKQGFSPFVIDGNYLLYIKSAQSQLLADKTFVTSPVTLVVFDMVDKKVKWQEAITDSNYRGVVAP